MIEAAGLGLIWLAPDRLLATAGAALTGFGYSLVYPGLGVEAVRRAPPEARGLAMGAYTVFLDVALSFGSPALGLVAAWADLGAAFLASASSQRLRPDDNRGSRRLPTWCIGFGRFVVGRHVGEPIFYAHHS